MNSIHVQRMMGNLRASIRDPPAEIIPDRKPRAPRQPKEEVIEPDTSDSDSESDTSYDSYEELDVIKQSFKEEPCEYVSPAGLDQAKTKKEAIQYLESKKCPKIPKIKKSAKNIKMDHGPPAPGPETAPAKTKAPRKTKAVVTAPAPVPVVAPVVAPAENPAKATKAKKAAAPADGSAPVKAKSAPSEYAKLVGSLMKGKKMTMAEAAKAAKAEIEAKKKV
jgi:hypothetical protein